MYQSELLKRHINDPSYFPAGFTSVNKKLKESEVEEISDKEREGWLIAFGIALTNDYNLSKKDLLTEFDWWVERLVPSVGESIYLTIDNLKNKDHDDDISFLNDVTEVFSIEDLFSIGLPELV
jgi:hypothetical protein